MTDAHLCGCKPRCLLYGTVAKWANYEHLSDKDYAAAKRARAAWLDHVLEWQRQLERLAAA